MTWGAIGGAVIGGVTSIYSGSKARKAAKQGAAAQAEAIARAQELMKQGQAEVLSLIQAGELRAAQALMANTKMAADQILKSTQMGVDAIERFFAIADSKLEPFRQQGLIAGDEMASMLGIPNSKGELVPYDLDKLRNLPGYEFTFGEGQRAVERGAAGTKLSGAQLKAQTEFGQGLADNYFQRQFGNLAAMYGIGANAAGSQAQAAMSAGSNIGQLYGNQGSTLGRLYGAEGENLARIFQNSSLAQADVTDDYYTNLGNLALGQGANTASLNSNLSDINKKMYGDIGSGLGAIWKAWVDSRTPEPLLGPDVISPNPSENIVKGIWGK